MLCKPPLSALAGSTLVEVSFAVGLVAFAFSSLFVMYSSALRMIRSQQETIGANMVLQERGEQIRSCNFTILTDATRLQAAVLAATPPQAASRLKNLVEEVTVSAYPPVLPTPTPLKIRRSSGVQTVVSAPLDASLTSSSCVRTDVVVSWMSDKRLRTRESSLIVAIGGVAR